MNRNLSAYETQPWMHYDDDKGITCSAEVRVGPSMADAEAEVQFLYDDPEEHNKANPDQIMTMHMEPTAENLWTIKELHVRGEKYTNKIGKWEEKGCNFFRNCVQAIQMGELPDIDELVKKELPDDDEDGRNGRGKIGRKSPKANPGALLGIKKPM